MILTPEEIKQIEQEAEDLYPYEEDEKIYAIHNTRMHFGRAVHVLIATKYLLQLKEERERAGKMREALEKILAMQEDDFNIMNLSPVDMTILINEVAETALNNYK